MRRAALLGSAAGLLAIGAPAAAANLQVVPYVELKETYTDNVYLTPTDKQSDLVTRTTAGIDATAKGGRVDLNLHYAANYLVSASDGHDDLRHDLVAGLVWRPVDADFNIHADGYINQAFYDRGGAVDFNPSGSLSRQLRTIHAFNGGWNYQNHSDVFVLQADYSAGYVDTSLDKATTDIDRSLRVNDTFNQSGNFRIGNRAGKFTFAGFVSYQGSNRRTASTVNARDFHQWRYGSDITFAINHAWSLIGRASYVTSVQTVFASRTGAFFEAGVNYAPSDRTKMELRLGRDRGHNRFNMDLDHRLTRTIYLRGSYVDQITTGQFVAGGLLDGISQNDQGQYVNDAGQVVTDRSLIYSFDNRILHVRDAQFGVSMRGRRLTVNFNGSWMRHNFSTGSDGQDERKTLTLNASYKTSPRGTLSGFVTGAHGALGGFSGGGDDKTLTGGLTYAFQLGEHLNATISATRSERNAEIALRDLAENSISLQLRGKF